jgi:Zn-dependent protease
MMDILQREVFNPLSSAMATPLEAPPLWLYALLLLAVVIATSVHEFGHAWMADRLGDPGPREAGRITLNPFKHFDALGFLLLVVTMLIGFPIGWGKPVKTDPTKYRSGANRGIALVAAAGPAMNLLTAMVLAPIARFIIAGGLGYSEFAQMAIITIAIVMIINLSLFCFNLVPIHPLDGSHIMASLLPEELAKPYRLFMQKFGVFLLLGLMYSGKLGEFIAPIILNLFRWLIGQ